MNIVSASVVVAIVGAAHKTYSYYVDNVNNDDNDIKANAYTTGYFGKC